MRIFNINPGRSGFSLIETLVVIALFALIGIVVSQSTAVSLTGSRKTDASSKVRENLNQALGVIERQLRSAKDIPICTGAGATSVAYSDENGDPRTIGCQNVGSCSAASYIYLDNSSFRLTNADTVCLTDCQFTCTQPLNKNLPPTVDIVLEGKSKEATGVEGTVISVQTSVSLRAY